jgi:hypothetical protein
VPSREFDRFDETVRKIISVSHEELKRREAEWKKKRQAAKKKRAARASSGRG